MLRERLFQRVVFIYVHDYYLGNDRLESAVFKARRDSQRLFFLKKKCLAQNGLARTKNLLQRKYLQSVNVLL